MSAIRELRIATTNIVCSVRVVINTAKEGSRGVLANHLYQEMTTARVIIHERREVVYEARDEYKGALC